MLSVLSWTCAHLHKCKLLNEIPNKSKGLHWVVIVAVRNCSSAWGGCYVISSFQAAIVQGVMVAHSEEDLLCIRVAYLKLTGTSLYTALQVGDAHGAQISRKHHRFFFISFFFLNHVLTELCPTETVQRRSSSRSAGHLSVWRLNTSCKLDNHFYNSSTLSSLLNMCMIMLK